MTDAILVVSDCSVNLVKLDMDHVVGCCKGHAGHANGALVQAQHQNRNVQPPPRLSWQNRDVRTVTPLNE